MRGDGAHSPRLSTLGWASPERGLVGRSSAHTAHPQGELRGPAGESGAGGQRREPPWKDFIEEIELRGMDGL